MFHLYTPWKRQWRRSDVLIVNFEQAIASREGHHPEMTEIQTPRHEQSIRQNT